MSFAVLCPDQGAQHPRMLDAAFAHAAARSLIDQAAQVLDGDPRRWLVDDALLYANRHAQPLICITQLATWTLVRERLPRPIAFAGYSVGELASYGLADAFDVRNLAQLAQQRARLMDEAGAAEPGGLIAIRGLTRASIESCCAGERAFIAIVNGFDAFVLGGGRAALTVVERRARERNGSITALRVGIASHTPLLEKAVEPFRRALAATTIRAPVVPVVAGIDARRVANASEAIETLSIQLARTVEWAQCIDTLYERGCRVFLEMPPGRALSRMARERHEDIEARGLEEFRDPAAAVEWVRARAGG